MKISVDGGGLGAKAGERFGNYIFSENLLKALKLYDKKNQYFVYTFENLKPRLAWMKGRVSLEELKEKKDVFLALNQAFPLYASGKIISFCHGLSYYFYPKHYSLKDSIRLRNQLDEMIIRSNIIVVSSIKVKKELELIAVKYGNKKNIVVLPFGIPFDMREKKQVPKVKKPYFLFVGMDHLIKNISFIKKAFVEIKKDPNYKKFRLIVATKGVSRKRLKKLYQGAAALLTASDYESFNLPVLEALAQGTPVVGLKTSIIPELAPYANITNNLNEFVQMTKQISKKPSMKTLKLLSKTFSWKKYVENLVKLY